MGFSSWQLSSSLLGPAWSLCSVTAGPHRASFIKAKTAGLLLPAARLAPYSGPHHPKKTSVNSSWHFSLLPSLRVQTTQPYSTEATSVAGGALQFPAHDTGLAEGQRQLWSLTAPSRDQSAASWAAAPRVINTPLPAIPLCPEASLMWLRHPFSVPPPYPTPGGS